MRYYCMTAIPISKRGTITIPPEIRRKLRLDALENPMFLVEEREGGLFLRLSAAIPVRDLDAETVAGWIADDEAGMEAFLKSGQKGGKSGKRK